jgi:hypothetical protein
MGKIGSTSHKVNLFKPQGPQQDIYPSGIHSEDLDNNTYQYYCGKKIRGKRYGLNYFLKPVQDKMIYADSHDYGKGETGDEPVEVKPQGVSQNIQEIGGTEEPFKVIKPYPFAAQNSTGRQVLLKGHKHPINGHIIKNGYIHKGNKGEKVKPTDIPSPPPDTGPMDQGLSGGKNLPPGSLRGAFHYGTSGIESPLVYRGGGG